VSAAKSAGVASLHCTVVMTPVDLPLALAISAIDSPRRGRLSFDQLMALL